MKSKRAAIAGWGALLGTIALGCRGAALDPTVPVAQGTEEAFGMAGVKCSAVRPPTEPDLMGWDSGSRANLSMLRQQGVVAVRYVAKGCNVELELLANCIGKGEYKYSPYAATDTKIAHNNQELFAELPIGAAHLGGKLKGGRALRTDYTLVGMQALPVGPAFSSSDLRGQGCDRATHVVSRVYVGGFAMMAGESSVIDASVNVFSAGMRAGQESAAEHVAREGAAEACTRAQADGKESALCAVPLRVGLLAIAGRAEGGCPDGASWDGKGCVGAKPSDSAPAKVIAREGTLVPKAPGPREGMVAIPSGTFAMGSDDGPPTEKPVHSTTVAAFQIDRTEVTVSAYDACVKAGACTPAATGPFCNGAQPERANHPVNCVNWNQSTAYCAWAGKRLPATAEWEYAARGPEARRWPWGQTPPGQQMCWNGQSTCPVGSHPDGLSVRNSGYGRQRLGVDRGRVVRIRQPSGQERPKRIPRRGMGRPQRLGLPVGVQGRTRSDLPQWWNRLSLRALTRFIE